MEGFECECGTNITPKQGAVEIQCRCGRIYRLDLKANKWREVTSGGILIEKPYPKLVIAIADHNVTVESIKGGLADSWHREDYLYIWISFDPYVANVITTGIELPIKDYSKEEFIQAVKDKLEKKIPEIKDKHRKQQEERELKIKRQEDLDFLAKQLETMIIDITL